MTKTKTTAKWAVMLGITTFLLVSCSQKKQQECETPQDERAFVALKYGQLRSIAVDNEGNMYLPDPFSGVLYKVSESGTVTTLRTYPAEVPFAVAVDNNGRVVVADVKNWELFQINGHQNATPVIPDKDPALFHGVTTLHFDENGNLYVGENDANVVRVVSANGETSIAAGNYKVKGNSDGFGPDALIDRPRSITVSAEGIVYLADDAQSLIRKIMPGGELITIAGVAGQTGHADGTGTEALFNHPRGIAVDKDGNVYVTDTNNQVVRKIGSNGIVTTFAGKAGEPGFVDGTLAEARFAGPRAITIDKQGNLLIADEDNFAIRMITPNGKVSTILAPSKK